MNWKALDMLVKSINGFGFILVAFLMFYGFLSICQDLQTYVKTSEQIREHGACNTDSTAAVGNRVILHRDIKIMVGNL